MLEIDLSDSGFKKLETGVKALTQEPLDNHVERFVLCGDLGDNPRYQGFVALFVDACDINKTHHFSIVKTRKNKPQFSQNIVKGGFLTRLCACPENPVRQEDMLHYSIKNNIPYAVLFVGESGTDSNRPLLTLYCLEGFDPLKVFACIHESVISTSAEIN